MVVYLVAIFSLTLSTLYSPYSSSSATQMPASILSGRPTRSRLECFPNEILNSVLSFSSGVTTLYAFVNANTQAQAVFETSARDVLTGAIRCSSMDLHLQAMLGFIISIRQCRKGQVTDEDFRKFVHRALSDQSDRTFELSRIEPTDAMDVLAHAASLCDFVTDTERSFISVRLSKVATKMQLVAARDRVYNKVQHPFTLDYEYWYLSATEIHRIRRALWRVCLYLEAFYAPYVPEPNNEHKDLILNEFGATKIQTKSPVIFTIWDATFQAERKRAEFQKCFFQKMTAWELEEMDCVWNHLSNLQNTFWHRPCPHCHHQSFLPDDLIAHLRECEHHANEGHGSSNRCKFRKNCKLFRFKIERGTLGRTTALDTVRWSGSLAGESNDGFLDHLECHGEWSGQASAQVTCCGQNCGFIDRACCMWDRDKITALRPFYR